jgi:DNA-nicking Smr family endonuclease
VKDKPDQDADLFRQAVEGAIPLAPTDRIAPTPRPHKAIVLVAPAQTVADELSDHGAGDAAPTEFLRPGLNRMTLRKLRRGAFPRQDELDLHGLSSDAARKLLAQFLHDAAQQGLRCVCVIHGKGWRSEGRDGILKVHTRHWLTQHAQVLAFCEAPQDAGGGGAVWVLLKLN